MVEIIHTRESFTPEKEEKLQQVREYAGATWRSIELSTQTRSGLPDDRLYRVRGGNYELSGITSITDIGLYLPALAAARDLNVDSTIHEDAPYKAGHIIETLKKLERTADGFFYTWYDTKNGQKVIERNGVERPKVATLDMAWLLTGLVFAQKAFPELKSECEDLIHSVKYSRLLDHDELLLHGEFDPDLQKGSLYHIDMLGSESRMAVWIGISQYGMPLDLIRRLGRSSPSVKSNGNIGLHYSDPHEQVLQWDGNSLEMLSPSLFVPETSWSLNGLTSAIQRCVSVSCDFGWRYPCETHDNSYEVDGHPQLSIRDNLKNSTVQSPTAAFLSLEFEPNEALKFLRTVEEIPRAYDPYLGFTSSVDLTTGACARSRLAVDQEMNLIASANYVLGERFKEYFSNQVESILRPIMEEHV